MPEATPLAAARGTLLTRRRRSSTIAFTVRLSLAIAATFAVLGAAGYLMMGDQLQRRLLATYAAEHRADAETVLAAEVRAPTEFDADRDIRQLLAAVARRPGVAEASLVGPDGIVKASGDPTAVGGRDVDPRIAAALRRGQTYTGREADPRARLRVRHAGAARRRPLRLRGDPRPRAPRRAAPRRPPDRDAARRRRPAGRRDRLLPRRRPRARAQP